MKKRISVIIAVVAIFAATGHAQTVYQKDRWGAKLYYVQDNTIRQKDRWGAPLYYLDGQTLRQKDRWGDAVYHFDFEPTTWQIACVILL